MNNILLCTLGASWAVVPEIYGFLNEEKLPLFQHHPENKQFITARKEYQLQAIDEIWICTTQGTATEESLFKLTQWLQLLDKPPVFRIWQAQGTNELADQNECKHIQELILRCCLKAHDAAKGGQVVMSLAGGRKTMSADMQWAATLFGCQALLHVIGAEYKKMPTALQQSEPVLFTQALDVACCLAIMPIITGQTQRSDLLDIRMEKTGAINTSTFPIMLPADKQTKAWPAPKHWLSKELKKREKMSSRLLGNYFFDLSRNEKHENWRSLYRLSPRIIEQLRATSLNSRHKQWLDSIPKADIHRHIGGCLSLDDQRKIARQLWQTFTEQRKTAALNAVQHLLYEQNSWDWKWANELKQQANKADLSIAILVNASEQQLLHNLWQVTEPRIALKNTAPKGFQAYERPGDLTGSSLLSLPAVIPYYVQCLVDQACAEGLAYVELRGSPQKYGDGLKFINTFYLCLQQTLASLSTEQQPCFRFIIIADRRTKSETELKQTIEMAVAAKKQLPDFIVGLDMAGDESFPISEKISEYFLPAFEQCLPVTIHAGEGEQAQSIWKAAYHLHADRIGHGLSIAEHEQLAERFRNRDICLELCPTSNKEVVGFYDPRDFATKSYPEYPLMQLWKQGLPLTLCTDNPGICRTSLSEEYLTAAAMSHNQLTIWDALAMIKQGFVHSFLSGQDKEDLLKKCDAKIYQSLLTDAWY